MPRAERPQTPTALAVALAVAAAAAACGGVAPGGDAVVRDSAGVRIVEHGPLDASLADRPAAVLEPAVRIGTVDGPEAAQLYRVTDATRLPDGRIAVLNSGTAELRFFDETGRHLRSIGGDGEGPGEFRSPRWLVVRPDTIVVFDPFQDNGRLSYLTLDGRFLSSERVAAEGRSFPSPRTMLPGDTLIDEVSTGSIPPGEVGHVRYTRTIIRYPPGASTVDSVATAPGSERFREALGNGIAQSEVPFGREGYTAIAPDRVFLGNGEAFSIDGFAFDGTHLISIRVAQQPPPVTDDLVERWIDARLTASIYEGRPDLVQRARTRYRATPVPRTMPAHGELHADPAGNLWVRRYSPPWDPANEWLVFDSDGRWRGTLELPVGLNILEIGEDYLLGLRTDDLDVEFVELYRLTWNSRSR